MSAVVGIDLSSKAIDLVKLDETTNRAEWVRCELAGKGAWERTLDVHRALSGGGGGVTDREWWSDVYLVAVEAPYGSGQPGTQAILNRVVGAVVASLPPFLRVPERAWVVRPDEYRTPLGLKGKPSRSDLDRVAPGWRLEPLWHPTPDEWVEAEQNGLDAYALALWARDENARGLAAA